MNGKESDQNQDYSIILAAAQSYQQLVHLLDLGFMEDYLTTLFLRVKDLKSP